MNGREKIIAALSAEGSPEIPVVIPYEGILIRDHWADLSALPWWAREDPDVATQAAWRSAVAQALEGDWAVLPTARPRAARESLRLEPRADGVYLVDGARGQARRLRAPEVGGWTARGGTESVHPEHPPETVEEIEARIPAPAPLDGHRYREEGRADLADALLAGGYAGLYPIRHVSAPLWGCYGLWGYEGLMVRVATAPDLVAAACERILALAVRDVQEAAILGAAGAAGSATTGSAGVVGATHAAATVAALASVLMRRNSRRLRVCIIETSVGCHCLVTRTGGFRVTALD